MTRQKGFGSIAVVGAGAIGGWIAARLSLAGRSVAIMAGQGTMSAIARDGLHLEEGVGKQTAHVGLLAETDGPQDLLILAVKAPALENAVAAARPLIGPATLVLPMLNGVPWWFTGGSRPLRSVDPQGQIAAAIPSSQLVGCVVHASCSRSAPNAVRVGMVDRLVIGEPAGPPSPRLAALAALLEEAGIKVEQSADIRSAIWYKLWGNATLNPLSALTRATADRLLQDPTLRGLMLEAMTELAEIGARIGCPIRQSGEERMAVTARLGAFKTSMLQDVEAGRQIELDALVAAPLEIARLHGVRTPALDLVYALARQLDRSLRRG